MTNLRVAYRDSVSAASSRHLNQPLGQILLDMGVMTSGDLLRALAIHGTCRAPMSRVCIAEGFATEDEVLSAQALQWGAMRLSLNDDPPDPSVSDLLPVTFCRDNAIVPWGTIGDMLVLATSRPEAFERLMAEAPALPGRLTMALASEREIHDFLAARHRETLIRSAETWVPEPDSCREFLDSGGRATRITLVACIVLAVAVLAVPNHAFALLALWGAATLVMTLGLKVAVLTAMLRGRRRVPEALPLKAPPRGDPLPRVSIMVPLFKEENVAKLLVGRLSRLTYPKPLLEIVLVLEETDTATRRALEGAALPPWFRVVEVPDGPVKTKPRALNYALGFCTGEIVGIYDAEDSPAPDQVERIVEAFRTRPEHVACLQGILDYYNPGSNWLARCFTMEYASWFRMMLPGLCRLGFAIPLGGTTVFFRRAAIMEVCGWDAHNVTEDADLGMRLARRGYVTEMVPTVTREEANNRLWPWVRQRSRWLKGYMVTYLVHMRRPGALWRELGPWRFLGFQVFFAASLVQFLVAPLLWSFWIVAFGLLHPAVPVLGETVTLGLAVLFLLATIMDLTIAAVAVANTKHKKLGRWVPTLLFYFPFGTLAAYKALYELIRSPFWWDKTSHGHSPAEPGKD
ncbi:glycosyltransferase family 2 protein [Mesobacterium pallidum]|uniref:glycosyltransferase family 2 protein n=1 Tax=Mesobacterium pallidum TaxID=2872037 RepID=UPI001EE19B6B|nr:glycosyltransferase family 2 protein [Mesobacterium pallidum]